MSFRLNKDIFKQEALKKVLDSDLKISEIELKIFQKSGNDPKKYKNIVYDVVTDIIKGQTFKDILQSLEQDKFRIFRNHFQATRAR